MSEEKTSQDHRQRPTSALFQEFIGSDWGPRPEGPQRAESADYTPARRARVSQAFPGERLVVPAGELKVRSNDTDYRFRPHSAFAHLTGLGTDLEPNAVLVLHPVDGAAPVDGESGEPASTHEAVLYFHPRTSRKDPEFWSNSRYGEFWVGARMSLEEMSTLTGLRCKHIESLRDDLAKDLGQVQVRVVPESDAAVEALVSELRKEASLATETKLDAEFARTLSEIRLTKDEWEVKEMQKAIDVTFEGFDEILRALPRAVGHWRGERVIEGAFGAKAREEGNGLGYETIAAAGNHANTLHWICNDGPVREGDLVLVDAGAEVDSLYTADITRTLPVNGTFSPAQAKVYQAVLDACEAALEAANKPGALFRDVNAAAMEVIAARLEEWGVLPCTARESLDGEAQYHRRWMPHSTSHHLGLDVHDCSKARREMYMDAPLEPGMMFTIEPGLYFREDDLKVPQELRGIGVRIEDDVLVTDSGVIRMSERIPRTIADVEAWIARVQRGE